MDPDQVVLLDEDGKPAGTTARSSVHHANTPLHLGFSCYLFDGGGRVLVTRRALSKRTFPGVWTNSFCGHPRPDEDLLAAAARHAHGELGVRVHQVHCLLPDFRYRAVDASGIVENEICPVLIARTDDVVAANPEEVCAWHWVAPEDLQSVAASAPWALSPWAVAQLAELDITTVSHAGQTRHAADDGDATRHAAGVGDATRHAADDGDAGAARLAPHDGSGHTAAPHPPGSP